MSDLIRVVDLEIWAHLGVPEEERAQAQRLLISLDLGIGSFAPAAMADDIAKTVNYFEVAEHVKGFAARQPRKLIETFAEQLARELLTAFPIRHLRLEVKKFILPDTAYISAVIERRSESLDQPPL